MSESSMICGFVLHDINFPNGGSQLQDQRLMGRKPSLHNTTPVGEQPGGQGAILLIMFLRREAVITADANLKLNLVVSYGSFLAIIMQGKPFCIFFAKGYSSCILVRSMATSTNYTLISSCLLASRQTAFSRISAALLLYGIAFLPTSNTLANDIYELVPFVVNADSRIQDKHDVSSSFSVFDGESIDLHRLGSVESLAFAEPSLEFGSAFNGNGSLNTMRGVGVDSALVAVDPSVSTYSDNVYRPGAVTGLLAMFDIDHTQVIKGPDGVVDGRNAIGGSIKFFTNKPNLERQGLSGFIGAGIGSYNHFLVKGALNIAWPEKKAGLRFSGIRSERDGFTANHTPGAADLDDDNDWMGRAQLLLTPSDDASLRIIYDRWRQDDKGFAKVAIGERVADAPLLDFSQAIPQPSGSRNVATSGNESLDNLGESFAIEASKRFGDIIEATYIGSYQDWELKSVFDIDMTNLDLMDFTDTEKSYVQTNELRLLRDLGDDIDFVFGLYAYDDDRRQALILPVETTIGSLFSSTSVDQDAQSRAVYVGVPNASIPGSEKWKGSIGFRYTEDDKRSRQSFLPFFAEEAIEFDLTDDWSSFDYKASLKYKLSNNWNLFGVVSTGFRSGGFMLAQDTDTPEAFNPEELVSVKFIAKYLTENKDRSTATGLEIEAYHYDYDNMQVSHVITSSDGNSLRIVTRNAAKASIDGLEARGNIRRENWAIRYTFAYMDAVFDRFDTFIYELDPLEQVVDISGNALPRTPEFSASFLIEYTLPDDKWRLFSGVSWSDGAEFNVYNDPRFRQPSHVLTHVGIEYRYEIGNFSEWSVSAGIHNLFDEEIPVGFDEGSLLLGNFNSNIYAPPRTWRLSIKKRF